MPLGSCKKHTSPHLLILKKISVDNISQQMLWSLEPSHGYKANIDTQILLKRSIKVLSRAKHTYVYTQMDTSPKAHINVHKISDVIVLSMKI